MIKNFLAAISAVLFSACLLKAQEKELMIGVKLTPELGFLKSSLDDNSKPRFALGAGIQVIKFFNKNIGVESGVNYTNRSWIYDIDIRDQYGEPIGGKVKASCKYVGVPILVRGRLRSFHATIGPSIDFFIAANSNTSLIGYREYIRKVNISLPISVGYTFPLTQKLFLAIEGRFNPQLTTIIDSRMFKEYARNVGFGIGLNYSLKD